MFLYLLNSHIPALHRVTARAVRAHLSLVHIGVAILAIPPHIRKNRFCVALRALHFLVHAPQGILGFIVIKLGNCADRTPCSGGMAVFARDRQCAVRTAAGLPLGRWCRSVGWLPREKQEPAQDLDERARNCPLYVSLPRPLCRPGGCSGTPNFQSKNGPQQLYDRSVLGQLNRTTQNCTAY